MSGEINLNDLLRAEPNDVGCEASAKYFEQLAEATVSGLRTELLFPNTTAHLRACAACRGPRGTHQRDRELRQSDSAVAVAAQIDPPRVRTTR